MNELQQEVLARLSVQMDQAIDNEVMINFYKDDGWIAVVLEDQFNGDQMYSWCKNQFDNQDWQMLNAQFLFKNSQDAVLFKLKWC